MPRIYGWLRCPACGSAHSRTGLNLGRELPRPASRKPGTKRPSPGGGAVSILKDGFWRDSERRAELANELDRVQVTERRTVP